MRFTVFVFPCFHSLLIFLSAKKLFLWCFFLLLDVCSLVLLIILLHFVYLFVCSFVCLFACIYANGCLMLSFSLQFVSFFLFVCLSCFVCVAYMATQKFDGSEVMIQYGTGSYSGHSVMAVRLNGTDIHTNTHAYTYRHTYIHIHKQTDIIHTCMHSAIWHQCHGGAIKRYGHTYVHSRIQTHIYIYIHS